MDINYKRKISSSQMIKVSQKIKNEIAEALAFNADRELCNKPLRDDQACLLVWSAKVCGISIPKALQRFLAYLQEEHGLARWITTAAGYLRIYFSAVGTERLNNQKMKDLTVICQFIVSVYAPAWLDIFYHPATSEGPQIMLNIRDYLLDAAAMYKFPTAAMTQLKKIYIPHGLSWLGPENVSLCAYSDKNSITPASIRAVRACYSEDQRKKMLWSSRYKLCSFVTADAATAPCLGENSPDKVFWNVTMNSNRSCERYVGRVKNIIEKGQIKDDDNADQRIKSMINLQDLNKFSTIK